VLSVAALPAAPRESPPSAPQVSADFDTLRPPVSVSGALRIADSTADGNAFVRATAPGNGRLGEVTYVLPPGLRPERFGGFSFRARAVGRVAGVRLIARNEHGRVILQRRLELEPADAFSNVNVPWTQWWWAGDFGGAPSEVRKIGLRLDADGPAELDFDDLALPPAGAGRDGREWLRRVAFGGRDVRMAEADGLLVASDAVVGGEQLTDADLAQILRRMRAARAMVRRLFGDAVRPIDGPTPPALLIFRRHADYLRCFEFIGSEWNVVIKPPASGGYTVQNIAATTFDPEQGASRPVFLHESIHAVLANDVRLLASNDRHTWLHEGFASYLQMCLYPQSVDRRALAANFRKPIPADGSGFFKPLNQVLGGRLPTRQYAQVGTLVAYVVDQKPQWLPVIAEALSAGGDAEMAFGKCGTTLPELQGAWTKWGGEKVGRGGDAGVLLAVPPEFAARDAAPVNRRGRPSRLNRAVR
jgi:hypothetical protein